MLGRLAESDDETVELRLLTDANYSVELDIIADELIDEHLAGELPATDQKPFEEYFLKSQVRQEKLGFALALKRRKTELRARAKLYGIYLPVAAAAIVVLGISLGIWRSSRDQSDVNNALVALQSAYRDQRPVQARISGLDYAPVLQERGAPPKIDYRQRDRARSMSLEAVAEKPGAAAYHALGKSYLAEREFDRAIDQFEAALKLDPQNALVHSDLGAALFELGKNRGSDSESGKQIEEFGRSLEHLDRALELDGSVLPALFNRALLYQSMKLPLKAQEDWERYLKRDPNSKWAEEAGQQLNTLKESLRKTSQSEAQKLQDFLAAKEQGDDDRAWAVVSWNYTSAGNMIANGLFDSYLDLESKGDASGALGKLQELEYLGQLEFQRADDRYTSDLVRFYTNSSLNQRRALMRARAQIRKGYELFLSSNLNSALRHYSQAHQAFEEIGNHGEAIFAEYLLGLCYLTPDLKRSDEMFARLRSTCEHKNYRWLLNQSLYRTASIRLTNNQYSESIDYAHQALMQSEQMPDNISVLKLLILLGDQYRALKNESQALNYFARALNLSDSGTAEPLQLWGVFTGIALSHNALGSHRAALEYQKEALSVSREMHDRPLIISRTYVYLGLTSAQLGHYHDALGHIERAFEAAKRRADEPSGREMMANSSVHAGDIRRQFGDYDQAIQDYDRSMQLYDELDYPYFTYRAHKGKLLSFIAQENYAATEEEIRTVLGLFEQYRSGLTSENHRNTFFDVEQSIYDLSIDFALSKKQNERLALEYCELSRARSLLDAMLQDVRVSERNDGPELRLPATFNPLTPEAIQQRMPERAQIIQYAVLDNKLIIWVINRSNVRFKEVALDAKTLHERVDEYLRGVNRPSASREAEIRRAAQDLYNTLIQPVESLLDKAKLLCIVPDKSLHYLPFAAVVSPAGRYLVEDFSLTQSPSSTVFVDRSKLASHKLERTEERLLSVGDPSFDRNAFPLLDRLPAAVREAEAVAGFYYPAARVLVRENASERKVRSEIGKANVLHFALHYIVNEGSSLLSQMALAAPPASERDQKDDGVWQVREIAKMKLPNARLVVLSACQTGIERQFRGEGAISIARPFLVAGVPLVIASLWSVDSEATEKLMVRFHQNRTRGDLPTAAALQRAQVEMITGEGSRYRQPYYWAAFTAIGGYTEY